MKRVMLLICATIISGGLFPDTAAAQAQAPQTIDLVKIDVQKLAAGYRASKVIGSNVFNDADETIGKIDDLLVSTDGNQPFVVLSVGGFLGMGSRLVVVPYSSLMFGNNKVILPNVNKDGLMMLPEFKYAIPG